MLLLLRLIETLKERNKEEKEKPSKYSTNITFSVKSPQNALKKNTISNHLVSRMNKTIKNYVLVSQ